MPPDDEVPNKPSLAANLNAVFYAVAMALDKYKIPLKPDVLENVIPGLVLTAAVDANWIEAPPEPTTENTVTMGDGVDEYVVDTLYRDEFVAALHSAIEFWKDEFLSDLWRDATLPEPPIEPTASQQHSPAPATTPPEATDKKLNPAELIDHFLSQHPEMLAYRDLAMEATRRRRKYDGGKVYDSVLSRLRSGRNVQKPSRVAIAEVIGCHFDDLLWGEKPSGMA